MVNHVLQAEGMYILSAPPASGKSYLSKSFERNAPNSVISRDDVREKLFGFVQLENGQRELNGWKVGEAYTNTAVMAMVEGRLSQRLPVLIDGTNASETERQDWARLALKYGVPCEVLFVDANEEECLARDKQRKWSVGEKTIKHFFSIRDEGTNNAYPIWDKKTTLKNRTVQSSDELTVMPLKMGLDTDIVGDVHGLLDDLKVLLSNAGYVLDSNGVPRHPDNRKLLFLGDVVDRGPDSIGVLKFVMNAVQKGGHTLLRGNHENRLLKNFRLFHEKNEIPASPMAPQQTFKDLMKLSKEERGALHHFVLHLPVKVVIDAKPLSIAAVHANILDFDPINTIADAAMYGQENLSNDTDSAWHQAVVSGRLPYLLVRGHILETKVPVQSVQVLEARQVYEGELRLLPVDAWLKAAETMRFPESEVTGAIDRDYLKAGKAVTIAQKCNYDYEKEVAPRIAFIKKLEKLTVEKLVNSKAKGDLRIYKYHGRVFWDNLWANDPLLNKARGLVLDATHNIVAHPFDKIFNWREGGAGVGLPDSLPIVAIEKLNGFLGVMSAYQFGEKGLLYSTTGSLDSPFVELFKTVAEKEIVPEKIANYLEKSKLSLMFEVLDPTDPHIVTLAPENAGIWLIGARSILDTNSPLLKEEELDQIGQELGLRRPKHWKMTLGDLQKLAEGAETEGWMVRKDDDKQEVLFKNKTTYYLTIKFLGRMKDDNWKLLYANPSVMRKTTDEEFYPLLDVMPKVIEIKDLLALPKEERVTLVRDTINKLRTGVLVADESAYVPAPAPKLFKKGDGHKPENKRRPQV